MTVRQRKKDPVRKEKPKEVDKKEENIEEGQDEAFIFFRPKNKKK